MVFVGDGFVGRIGWGLARGLQVAEFFEAAEILAVELGVVAEVEAKQVFGMGEAVGEVGGGVSAGNVLLEGGFVAGDGDFDLGGFGEPDALLTPLGVDGFGEEVVFVAVLRVVRGDVLAEQDAELGFVFGVEEAALG